MATPLVDYNNQIVTIYMSDYCATDKGEVGPGARLENGCGGGGVRAPVAIRPTGEEEGVALR
ncbi:hypothetical protein JCM33774_21820 [Actinophytocola sp. KF-1]